MKTAIFVKNVILDVCEDPKNTSVISCTSFDDVKVGTVVPIDKKLMTSMSTLSLTLHIHT